MDKWFILGLGWFKLVMLKLYIMGFHQSYVLLLPNLSCGYVLNLLISPPSLSSLSNTMCLTGDLCCMMGGSSTTCYVQMAALGGPAGSGCGMGTVIFFDLLTLVRSMAMSSCAGVCKTNCGSAEALFVVLMSRFLCENGLFLRLPSAVYYEAPIL